MFSCFQFHIYCTASILPEESFLKTQMCVALNQLGKTHTHIHASAYIIKSLIH